MDQTSIALFQDGNLIADSVGINSQDWVDASDDNWGDPSGPGPIGTGAEVEGDGISVYPWLGEASPAIPTPAQWLSISSFDGTCAEEAFIGVHGSGDPPGLGTMVSGVWNGFSSEFSNDFPGVSAPQLIPLVYPALSTASISLFNSDYLNSIYDGVGNLLATINALHSACPAEQIVLAGYSQGALVIHLTLKLYLANNEPGLLNQSVIGAVALVADPAKVANDEDTLWQSDQTAAGSGVSHADGVWTDLRDAVSDTNGLMGGPLPSSVDGRTIEICHQYDPVCAPGSDDAMFYLSSKFGAASGR